MVYAVITGEKPVYLLIVAITGLIAAVPVALFYKKIESDIESKLDELEKEES